LIKPFKLVGGNAIGAIPQDAFQEMPPMQSIRIFLPPGYVRFY
jgi:hypothetical protein